MSNDSIHKSDEELREQVKSLLTEYRVPKYPEDDSWVNQYQDKFTELINQQVTAALERAGSKIASASVHRLSDDFIIGRNQGLEEAVNIINDTKGHYERH